MRVRVCVTCQVDAAKASESDTRNQETMMAQQLASVTRLLMHQEQRQLAAIVLPTQSLAFPEVLQRTDESSSSYRSGPILINPTEKAAALSSFVSTSKSPTSSVIMTVAGEVGAATTKKPKKSS